MEKYNFVSNSEQETIDLGEKFAKDLKVGDIVAFYGELGTGKTEFIKGICNYFNVSDIVTSPTFTIINHYVGTLNSKQLDIFHLDLYRIKNLDELQGIGFSDCIYDANSIKLIEWADKSGNILKENANYSVEIIQNDVEENNRTINITKL